MEWYYAENNERRGPITEAELDELATKGRIGAETPVWREGWENWKPFGEAGMRAAAGSATSARCLECGNTFPTSEMVQYAGAYICPACKPRVFQKVREGIELTGAMVYGGFWLRLLAKIIDGIVLWIVGFIVQLPLAALMQGGTDSLPYFLVSYVVSFAINLSYSTLLIGKYGATLGKMACGLRVVTATGGRVSYGLACGRYFGEILSSLILCIGYLMAAFDEEKRTLHDRICNTRVIRPQA